MEKKLATGEYNLDTAKFVARRIMNENGRSAPGKATLTRARGEFSIQLGAVRSKARAVNEAQSLTDLHQPTLGRLTIVPIRADLGSRGIYYRLRVGQFRDRGAAELLCRKLLTRQQNCIVVKP